MTPSIPARNRRRTSLVVSGVWLRLSNRGCSASSAATDTSRWRSTSAVKVGTEIVRRDDDVFGWSCRKVG